MVKRILIPFVLVVGTLVSGCGEKGPFEAMPVFERAFMATDDNGHLQPARLRIRGDSLFVAYNGLPRLDMYDLDLNLLKSFDLQAPDQILPTDFAVTDTSFVVCDHAKGMVAVFDRTGRYIDSFSTLPNGSAHLSPMSLTAYRGVAYAADVGQKRVLAISLNDAGSVTERGELILAIPGQDVKPLGFPSAVMVTDDGRLLIGDAGAGRIRVFTCDGRSIYDFDAVPGLESMAPQAFAVDAVIDPSLQSEDSFDPSGVRQQGRVHVADGLNGRIHMFNPLGAYLGSYPEEIPLVGPSGLAIDRTGGRVFVAEPTQGRILVYRIIGE